MYMTVSCYLNVHSIFIYLGKRSDIQLDRIYHMLDFIYIKTGQYLLQGHLYYRCVVIRSSGYVDADAAPSNELFTGFRARVCTERYNCVTS